jgi:hypothetical protein
MPSKAEAPRFVDPQMSCERRYSFPRRPSGHQSHVNRHPDTNSIFNFIAFTVNRVKQSPDLLLASSFEVQVNVLHCQVLTLIQPREQIRREGYRAFLVVRELLHFVLCEACAFVVSPWDFRRSGSVTSLNSNLSKSRDVAEAPSRVSQ